TGLPHIRSGRLHVLGTGGRTRTPVLPDVPTIAEAGVAGYEAVNLIGLVAPAGTPPALVARLHSEIAPIPASPELQKPVAPESMEVMRMSSAEFGAFMAAEMGKWERVVKEGGIKAE